MSLDHSPLNASAMLVYCQKVLGMQTLMQTQVYSGLIFKNGLLEEQMTC